MPDERRNYDKLFEAHFDKLHTRIDNILEYNKRQDERGDKLEKLMTGNGTPENGIIVKLSRIDERQMNCATTLKLHWKLFIGMFTLIAGVIIRYIII